MNNTRYLARFFVVLLVLGLFGTLVMLPYSRWWVGKSGDMDVAGAVKKQAAGQFVMFGSGMSQDFVDYKLRLYSATKPDIVALGSSRVMQFRSRYFTEPFLNVGGTAGNLAVLRSTAEAMLAVHKPKVILLGLDFWWFTKKWEPNPQENTPPTSGSYNYGFDTLKTPWEWLLTGKVSTAEFFAPLTGAFRADRYGIMAQRFGDGFASDGSWYYTADVTGQQKPFDYKFGDTLKQVEYGIKAFSYAPEISEEHVDAFADIYYKLRVRGVKVFVFISPLSTRVLEAIKAREDKYPQLFKLHDELRKRGIDAVDLTDMRRYGTTDCEFVDGFHGGDIAYARLLRQLARYYMQLGMYVNMKALEDDIRDWAGYAMRPDERVTGLPEVDFMHFGCPKKK